MKLSKRSPWVNAAYMLAVSNAMYSTVNAAEYNYAVTANAVEATSALTCSIESMDSWSTGFVLNKVKVTNNTGEAIDNWEIKVQLSASNIALGNNWNSVVSLDGNNILTASNVSYNGSLKDGDSTTFGLQGSFSGNWVTPSCIVENIDIPDDGGTTDPGDGGTTDPGSEPETPDNGTTGTFRINESGKLTKSGEILPMNCVSWFGLEGQFEPKNAENNAGGAPMEMYIGNMWWANNSQGTGRTIEQTMQEIVAKGVNLIRVPIAPQTLDATNEQGIGDIRNGGVLKNHADVRQLNSRQALTDFIIAANKYNLNVIIDIHSCSNYLGWRAGDLEATPPYVDADRVGYDFTREDYACGAAGAGPGVTVQEYNEEIWKENLAEIAGLSKELGVDNIVGIDIFNEPWNYTWPEWKRLSESAYETISAINDDMVIVVEGIGSSLKDGTAVEHGSDTYTPNWGENLYSFADDPLNIPKDRLILSPHTYGPSVFVQNHFLDKNQPECVGLDGDAAGQAGCDIVIDPTSLEKGWDEHFGYLREQGYAVLIGEFGGMMDWPMGADTYYKNLWSHTSGTVDKEWQTALVDYMVDKEIEGCYWSLNPESADTGGLYEHSHVPVTNEAGWGTWLEINPEKLALLEYLWKGITTPDGGTTDPGDGGTTDPGDGGTTDPGDGGTTDPGDGGTTDPGDGGTTDPGDGGTTDPGDGGTTDPGDGGTTDPGDGGTTDPGDNNIPDDETTGTFRIDDAGNLTKSGDVLPMNCVSWFGLEGQFEPKNAENNAGGAPMELYVGNMWWANNSQGTGRTIEQTMQEIVAKGANLIRVPIAPQTLDENNEQGIGDVRNGGVLKNHADVRQLNSRQALTDFIVAADKYNLNVIIDIHSCSNYLGWRAGDLEATPPYVDANRVGYDYTREDYACGASAAGPGVTVQEYNEEIWKENLAEIAGLSAELGVDNIVGIDIFNEPWNYTWAEWKRLSESAYETISAVNDDMVIVVEGIGSSLKDGTAVEHGSETYTPNWGENLYSFANDPLNIPKNRLILSPHTYGPSVFVQNHFLDKTQPECVGLSGDEAGQAGCNIVIDPASLQQGWDEHFGYLREQGYAVLVGEFGGMMDWPLGADTYYKNLWSHTSGTVDREWQTALVDYMVDKEIEGCYWSLNPESADTGGLYEHAHVPATNEAGWGQWLEINPDKMALLEYLWKGIPVPDNGETNPDGGTENPDGGTTNPGDGAVVSGLMCTDGQADIWPGGVVVNNYKVTNTGTTTLASWEVALDFGNTVNVTNIWNASASTNGDTVTISGNSLNPGQSMTFGFQGSYSGSITTPSCVTPSDNPGTGDPSTGDPSTGDPSTGGPSTGEPETDVPFRIDDEGNVTKAGEILPMNCVSWFGLEGQFEPKDAENNAGGAPMEMYIGNMWWANNSQGTGRTIEQTMEEIVAQGVTVIRVPIAPQTLDKTNEQGIGNILNGGVLKNHKDVQQLNSRQALTDFIVAADKYNLNVIIDIHSCSNYLGWRAGDLEATPPYVDANRVGYDYTREDYACSSEGVGAGVIVQEYNETLWKKDLAEIAGLSEELGVNNIVGIDILNEPWNYTWTEWKALAESAYETISSVDSDMLIIVEGIGSALKDGTQVEHGTLTHVPNWGENLYGFAADPLNIPKDRLILSPHTYGPSVFVQNHFLDLTQAECEGLDGDAAGKAGCDIVINPTVLKAGWDEHFGYLREQGYAILIGEFGGLMDWPLSAEPYYSQLWNHVSSTVDKEWQTALVDYMGENKIEGCYWSLNPESGDTGGIFKHAYSENYKAGWGEWLEMDPEKLSLLENLWK